MNVLAKEGGWFPFRQGCILKYERACLPPACLLPVTGLEPAVQFAQGKERRGRSRKIRIIGASYLKEKTTDPTAKRNEPASI